LPLIDPARARGPRPAIRPLDALIVGLSVAALVALSIAVYGGPASASVVVSSGDETWIYPLSQDRVIDVPGILGDTRVSVAAGSVRIEDSPCVNKTCVASPPLKRAGDWSACLPNGVFVRIEGSEEEDEIDAIVR